MKAIRVPAKLTEGVTIVENFPDFTSLGRAIGCKGIAQVVYTNVADLLLIIDEDAAKFSDRVVNERASRFTQGVIYGNTLLVGNDRGDVCEPAPAYLRMIEILATFEPELEEVYHNDFETAMQVLTESGILSDDSVVLEAERARDDG